MKRIIFCIIVSAFTLFAEAEVLNVTTNNKLADFVNGKVYIHDLNADSVLILREPSSVKRTKKKLAGISPIGAIKTLSVTAGGLYNALTREELNSTTNLTIAGTLDARDFRIMRDSMPLLDTLDFQSAGLLEYTGTDGTVTGIHRFYPANEVPAFAFCDSITNQGKTSLNKVVLSATATSVGASAFQYCTDLKILAINSPLVSIRIQAFFRCSSLIDFFIPSTVTSIERNAFLGCDCFITVDPDNNFYSGTNGILFNKNQTILYKYPINRAGSYTIPSTVTSISNYAFFDCESLTSVTIPPSVTTIGMQAFSHCSELLTVFIPAKVTSLNYWVFLNSPTMITVDDNNPDYSSLDGVLFDKNKLTLIQFPTSKSGSYTIPSTVNQIMSLSFYNCINLTNVNFPSSVTMISTSAFQNCTGLITLELPESINIIGSYAFSNCSGLKSIYAFSSTPVNLGSYGDIFENVDKANCTLYVLQNLIPLYETADGWKDFQHIVGIITGLSKQTINRVTLYPNPAIDAFHVTGLENTFKVTLTDLNGKTVLVKQATGNDYLSIGNLPSGVYTVRITNGGGIIERKLVKK